MVKCTPCDQNILQLHLFDEISVNLSTASKHFQRELTDQESVTRGSSGTAPVDNKVGATVDSTPNDGHVGAPKTALERILPSLPAARHELFLRIEAVSGLEQSFSSGGSAVSARIFWGGEEVWTVRRGRLGGGGGVEAMTIPLRRVRLCRIILSSDRHVAGSIARNTVYSSNPPATHRHWKTIFIWSVRERTYWIF